MEAHLSRSVRLRLLVDEREPRDRRLGARLQLAENLLSLLLELGMSGLSVLLELLPHRSATGHSLLQLLHAVISAV